jgi:hypothetical protein
VATPTPLTQPLRHNSEVRSNIIRASHGDSAQIIFNVGKAGPVSVVVYDRLGRSVAVLEDGSLEDGQYILNWSGAADEGGMAASGIYVVRIQTPSYVDMHKMMLVK